MKNMQDYIPRKIDINATIDPVTVKQFDHNSRFLHVRINDIDAGDGLFDLTGCSATLYVQREGSDTPVAYVPGEVSEDDDGGGIVTFLLPGGVTQKIGRYECEIGIYQGDETDRPIISTKPFILTVEKSIKNADAIEATGEFSALDRWATDVQIIRNQMAALAASPAGSGGDVGTELRDIRIGADGTEYSTAGDAVRAQATNLAADATYLNGVIEWESGAFGSSRTNKVTNAARIRNTRPVPVDQYRELALPDGYTAHFWFLDKDMVYSNTFMTGKSLTLPDSRYPTLKYVNIQISKDNVDTDISGDIEYIENNFTAVLRSKTDTTLAVSGLPADAEATGVAIAAAIRNARKLSQLAAGTDLNSVNEAGTYRLSYSGIYGNSPLSAGRRFLMVISDTATASLCQILYSTATGDIYVRSYHDGGWDAWVNRPESNAKMLAGLNSHRKALDHGGFFSDSLYQDSPKAFLDAAKEGIIYHNLDIVFSSDNVPFAVHNDALTDINDVTFTISETTAENIKTHTLGDSAYNWVPQTLAETHAYIKSLGGVIDMVDVSASPNLANAQALPAYYRAHNINPSYTNWDSETLRDAFIQNGAEFGVYMVCNTVQSISNAVSYINLHADTKFALNIMAINDTVRTAAETNMETLSRRGVALYVYRYNNNQSNETVGRVPGWADGVLSERVNVNYLLWNNAISG